MALSDHERKLLAEMEAALEQEDPRLLSTLTGKARTRQSSRALLGLSILVVGLLLKGFLLLTCISLPLVFAQLGLGNKGKGYCQVFNLNLGCVQ